MKKLLTTMSAVAAAMSLFATDSGALSGTSFEGLTAGDALNINDNTGELVSNLVDNISYWRTNGTDTLTIKEGTSVGASDSEHRAAAFLQRFANNRYLNVKTASPTNSISRYVKAGGTAEDINGGTDATKRLYFDSYIRFTAFDGDQTIDLGEGGKLAIWLKEEELEGGSMSTNLMITAGYLDTSSQAGAVVTNYNCYVDGGINFNDGGWHRVTVMAMDNIYASGTPKPGFVVFIDKTYAQCTDNTTMGISGTLNGTADFYNSVKALFPSACQTGNARDTISAVDFAGQGDVDELVFTRTMPDFAKDVGIFTIQVPNSLTGIERITFTTNNVPEEISATTTFPITDALRDDGIKIDVEYTDGYMAGAWLGGMTPDPDGYYHPDTDGQAVVIAVSPASASVNGKGFASLADAIAYVNDPTECASGTYTIKLFDDASSDVEFEFTNAGITNILDLAGNDIAVESGSAINLSAGSLVITNSTSTIGVVSSADADPISVESAEGTSLTIAGGQYDDFMDAQGDLAFVYAGAAVLKLDASWAADEVAGYASKVQSGYELTLSGGYYVLTEAAPTYTVKFISGEGSTTNEYTEIKAGTEQTVPTPASVEGKSFSAWDPAIAGATVTVNADATYTALYTNNIYTITFVIGENSSSVQKEYGSEITSVPEIPVRQGYTGAWDDDPAGDTVTGDKTYTYTYSAETYTITYMFGANELTGLTPATYTVEDAVTLTNEVDLGVMGVAFEAWTNAEGTVVAGWAAGAKTGNQTFYAKTGAVVQEPTVDGNPVTPAEVFTVADSESPIVYPSAPTLSGEVGSQTITFGGTTVDVPAYYTASLSGNTISLALNDNAIPTIGATSGIPAMEVGSSTVGVGLTSTNTKLYYGLAKSSTVGGTYAAPATLTQGTGEAMELTVDKIGGATAEFYKIYVTDIAPAQN